MDAPGRPKECAGKPVPPTKMGKMLDVAFASPETRVRLPCLPLGSLTFLLLGRPFVLANPELSCLLVGEILWPITRYYLFLFREGALILCYAET